MLRHRLKNVLEKYIVNIHKNIGTYSFKDDNDHLVVVQNNREQEEFDLFWMYTQNIALRDIQNGVRLFFFTCIQILHDTFLTLLISHETTMGGCVICYVFLNWNSSELFKWHQIGCKSQIYSFEKTGTQKVELNFTLNNVNALID